MDFFRFHEVIETESGIHKLTEHVDLNQINIAHLDQPLYELNNEEEMEYEANITFYDKGIEYTTDDNGNIYKQDGKLLANENYTVNDNTYITDENGRIVDCVANPVYTENGSRNIKEQCEAGGMDRRENDDGGHLVARILGGAEGIENLVAMRSTINRGDYKSMENEISKAVQDGKDVKMKIHLEYEGESTRPDKITVEDCIDGKKTIRFFDNEEGSEDLLNIVQEKISKEDFEELKWEIEDRKEEGPQVSITSLKVELQEDGKESKVSVTILDEITHLKSKIVYDAI